MVTGQREPAADRIYPASVAVSSQHRHLTAHHTHTHTHTHTQSHTHTLKSTQQMRQIQNWSTLERQGPIGWHLTGRKPRRNERVHFHRSCRGSDPPPQTNWISNRDHTHTHTHTHTKKRIRAMPVANCTFHSWILYFCMNEVARDKSDRKTEISDLHHWTCCSQSAIQAVTQQERKRPHGSSGCQMGATVGRCVCVCVCVCLRKREEMPWFK